MIFLFISLIIKIDGYYKFIHTSLRISVYVKKNLLILKTYRFNRKELSDWLKGTCIQPRLTKSQSLI